MAVAALDVGTRVHDALQLVLLQLPDLLYRTCLLLSVFWNMLKEKELRYFISICLHTLSGVHVIIVDSIPAFSF